MIDQNMDPNQFDLVAGARLAFKQEITDKTNNIENIERKISNFKKTAKRLKSKKSKDVIALLLANHIGQLARTIDANRKDIQIAKEADAIVSDYEFEQDPTQMILTPFGRIFR
jgi:isochorismate hydrolase